MKIKVLKVLIILAIAIITTSCGPYGKLLKSNDPIEQYQAANQYYFDKKYSKASSLYELAMQTLVGTEFEDTILFRMAKLNFNTKNYYTAGELFDQYRNKFAASQNTAEAEYLYAMSFYNLSGDVEKDQTNTRRAIVAFNEYANRYPNSPFTKEIKVLTDELYRKMYYKKFLNAKLYYKIGQHLAAVTSLRAILKNTPETPYRQDIMYLICKSWFDYARKSIYAKQLDRYLKTIDAYYSYKTTFPESIQFNRELERMKDIAEDFVAKNGVTAQSIETSVTKIENAKKTIIKAKDDIFNAKGKNAKKTIKQEIKKAREIIKIEKKNARTEAKLVKENDKIKMQEVKAREKAEDKKIKEELDKRKKEAKERNQQIK